MSRSDYNSIFATALGLEECIPSLISRARHNQIPLSASQRTELDELVSQGQKELMTYSGTFAQSQSEAFRLENQKKRLEEQVSFAKSLMAPIRKLPPEILSEIFITHGTANVVKSEHCDIPGLTIASVCAHWRSIAFATTRLWHHIIVIIKEERVPWYTGRSLLVEKLLELSGNTFLTITIDAWGKITEAPPVLSLLCQQAHRWERLYGVCSPAATGIHAALSSLKGRLYSLDSFQFLDPSQVSLACIKDAPKLRKMALFTLTTENIDIPWNQLMSFTVAEAAPSLLVQAIAKMPQLTKLAVALRRRPDQKIGNMRPVRSNLTSLEIGIVDPITEQNMSLLFDALTLPNLVFLSIVTEHHHLTNQDGQRWSANQLPSLISRSGALLTTLDLRKTWIPTNDLVSLLHCMSRLVTLSIIEPSYADSDDVQPMINNELLVSICCEENRQTILPNLTSLTLEDCKLSSFSVAVLVKLVQSRCKPLCPGVAPIGIVRLKISGRKVTFQTEIHSLLELRNPSLDIRIENNDGDVGRYFES